MSVSETARAVHSAAPSPWRMVIALMLIYMYAFIDRTFIALLVDPIRAHLGASDVQMGLLLGVGFALFFCVCSIPAGYLADRINRRAMLAGGSVVWGAMTVLCGLSGSMPFLFSARAGVGSAEGVIAPTVYSLMRDAVPARSRPLAFSIYGLAPMIGTAFALVTGGLLFGAFKHGAFANVPVLSSLAPWQGTLVIVGLMGMPLSLLLLTFREPARVATEAPTEGILRSLLDACRFMTANGRLYGPLLVFSGTAAMLNFAIAAWLPAALGRAFSLPPDQVGPALGIMEVTGGAAGLLIAGWLMNRTARRGGGVLFYGIAGVVGTAVGVAIALTSSNIAVGYSFNVVGLLFIGVSFAVGAATLTAITPSDKIGRVSAVYLIFETLAGQGLGPLCAALLSQHLFSGPFALPRGLSATMLLCALAASLAALVLRRAIALRPIA
jgi:MFS transporter, Spinster family, sphingosine-1-phosphate transporter